MIGDQINKQTNGKGKTWRLFIYRNELNFIISLLRNIIYNKIYLIIRVIGFVSREIQKNCRNSWILIEYKEMIIILMGWCLTPCATRSTHAQFVYWAYLFHCATNQMILLKEKSKINHQNDPSAVNCWDGFLVEHFFFAGAQFIGIIQQIGSQTICTHSFIFRRNVWIEKIPKTIITIAIASKAIQNKMRSVLLSKRAREKKTCHSIQLHIRNNCGK